MSLRKDTLAWGITGLAVILVVAAALFVIVPRIQSQTTVRLGDGVFRTLIERNSENTALTLANIETLDKDKGVLFVYDTAKKWPLAMNGVGYSVDAVWLDTNKEVAHIIKNVPPNNYPQQYLPGTEALYLLVLPAGTVDEKKINAGKEARFNESGLGEWL